MRALEDRFASPPETRTEEGALRRVGFEIEFKGLGIEEATALVHRVYGGRVVRTEPFVHHVRDTPLGDFRIELDWGLLKDHTLERRMRDLGADGVLTDRIVRFIGEAAATLVPFEIATPPVPLDRLDEVERLRDALHVAGGSGTRASPLYALGLHVNAEAPRTDSASVLAVVRAFAVLQDGLMRGTRVDPVRRVTPFIDPWPGSYRTLVLDRGYRPDSDRLVDDYLEHNPTRNRALDLLPLLASIDPRRVFARIHDPQVRARPAYHYRLPDCALDDADWRVAHEWERWVAVERLAADPDRLWAVVEAPAPRAGPLLRGLIG